MHKYRGSCHCGNISVLFDSRFDSQSLPRRACGCTFCTRHTACWTSDRDGSLQVSVQDESLLSRYRFGTGTADFLLCSRCGAVACAVFNLDDQNYAVLNTRILDGQKTLGDDIASANYDAEDTAERLERRKNNWIPRVNIETRS